MQNPDEDTEWNDILRAKGIIPEKKKVEPSYDINYDALYSIQFAVLLVVQFYFERLN